MRKFLHLVEDISGLTATGAKVLKSIRNSLLETAFLD